MPAPRPLTSGLQQSVRKAMTRFKYPSRLVLQWAVLQDLQVT